ncbi:four helix bundle protein [Victivallis sp. Marseille-Q1083]|uniref:four helix bundle protein n=1 Tax=Victivallis sp. Marseille-Q1083 TaxID=2717288 RepID=UPI0034C6DA4C
MHMSSPIQEKSYQFALRVVKMYQHLTVEKREFVLSKQVLRSGTGIGANVREANGAQSDRDFLAKLTISYKEALETEYWLMLLRDTDYLSGEAAESILRDCRELMRMLGSAKITLQNKLHNTTS